MNRKVRIITLGCKVNQYESEAIRQLFINNGDSVHSDGDADIFVINTCSVTHVSAKKSRQTIRRIRRNYPQAIIAVIGCYSQTAVEEVMALSAVNLIIGTKYRDKVVEYLQNISIDDCLVLVEDDKKTEFEELKVKQMSDNTRAFIKIQDGCNMFCTYCIIPYARGQIRSRALADIITEVQRLVSFGYKEVVLTGIHLASYGLDLKEDISLATVIESISDIIGLERIRLGSIEPRVITADFLASIAKVEQLCPQFHLSLQSGCDETLARMNRRYTTSEYREAVDKIRKYYPQAAITTDVIVGFPAETEAEFTQTYHFVEEINFALLHVFPFSRREGTKAYDMPEQIDNQSKKRRSEQLIRLAQEMTASYLEQFIGQELMVLIESVNESGAYGLTKEHVAVQIDTQNVKSGNIVPCLATSSDGSKLLAKPL